jgi:hypothetical protein
MTKRILFITDGNDSHSFNTISALSKKALEYGHTPFLINASSFNMKDTSYRHSFFAEKFDVVVGYTVTDEWLTYLRKRRFPRIILRDVQNIENVDGVNVSHTNEWVITNINGIGKRKNVLNIPFFPSTWEFKTGITYECSCVSKFPLSEGFGNCSRLYEGILNNTPRVSTFGKASYGNHYKGFVDSSVFRSIYHNSVTTLVNSSDEDSKIKAINSSVIDAILGGSIALIERGRIWNDEIRDLVEEFDNEQEFNSLINKYVAMFNENNKAYSKIVESRMHRMSAICDSIYSTFFNAIDCI